MKNFLGENYAVTIITALYNKAVGLEERLNFMAKQGGNGLAKHLLLDHSSTDGSSEIASRFCREHQNFTYVLVPNKTQSPCEPRNLGIQMSDTDYIMVVDADDIALLDKLGNAVEYMDAHPNCAALCGNRYISEEIGKNNIGSVEDCWQDDRNYIYGNLYDSVFDTGYLCNGDLIRRSKIKYPYRLVNAEDFIFGIEFLYGLGQSDYISKTENLSYIWHKGYSERNQRETEEHEKNGTDWFDEAKRFLCCLHPELKRTFELRTD